jgi:molybdopterin-guanine dinucleotide biosynthesis protein A
MRKCSAIVLAGGRATRLGGANKAMLQVGNKRLIDRVLSALNPIASQIILVGHLAEGLSGPVIDIVPDKLQGGSALIGIYSGLQAARNDVALVVACDMPFLSTPLLKRIAVLSEGYDVAVPRVGNHLEALHAAYRRSCLPVMREAISQQQHKIIDFYTRLKVREIGESEIADIDPDGLSFFNVNTPADLKRANTLASRDS